MMMMVKLTFLNQIPLCKKAFKEVLKLNMDDEKAI